MGRGKATGITKRCWHSGPRLQGPEQPRVPEQPRAPYPAIIASLVEFVQSLPDESYERPAKRARPSDGTTAVTVARHALEFVTQSSTSSPEETHITRKNIGEHLRIGRIGSYSDRPPILEITPQKNYRKASFRVELPLDWAKRSDPALSPDADSLGTALRVAWTQGYDPEIETAVWAAVDMDIVQTGSDVKISIHFNVQWNASQSMDRASAQPQLDMRDEIMRKCFSGLDLPPVTRSRFNDRPSMPTIQDFYEALCVPERDMPGSDLPSAEINGLSAKLYPFQRKSVQWLLNREGVQWHETKDSDDGVQAILDPYQPDTSSLPISFTSGKDACGDSVAISPLFGMITRDPAPFHRFQNLKGGILAEEMGLGKTLEMISLILLHRRPEEAGHVFDPYLGRQLRPTKGTLIVTPPSLRDQWLSELAKHAPELKVKHYLGLRHKSKFFEESVAQELVEELAQYDVVITTYEILRSEIHVAVDPPSRASRTAKAYTRAICPLVQLSWWRVCIDEAQMVENWRSDTALMARLIPRINAWAITGTPVKDSVQEDLRGLLAFLRFEPYASNNDVWKAFSTYYKDIFRQVFNLICLRHTKSEVRKEIELPSQKRYVITMPFSAVEEQHYQTMFKTLVQTLGLDITGAPLTDDWSPNDATVQQAMRLALDRLRQIVLHPEIGGLSRHILGNRARDRPLRTVAEVLDAMMEQSESSMRTDQRALFSLKLQKGQVLAVLGKTEDALAIWEEVKQHSTAVVADCRDQLQKETEATQIARQGGSFSKEGSEAGDGDGDGAPSPRVSEARRRLRYALEVQHKAVFFCANAYYSLKSDTDRTAPDSDDFKRLEKLEVEGYESAKTIRKEILQESQSKAKQLMDKLAYSAEGQDFAVIPEMDSMDQYGIETRTIAEASETLCELLDEQAGVLDDWREHVIQLLLKSLLDEESEEVTGEEYEQSTKVSDEISVYVQALRTVLADRHQHLSGQRNELVDFEYKASKRLAEAGDGPCPEKLLQLFAVRDELKPDAEDVDELRTLRGIVSALRGLSTKLGSKANKSDNERSATELAIVTSQLKHAQTQLTQQTKAITLMEQEATLFTDTMNARIEFYRQLQAVSDMVADYEGEATEATLQAVMRQEDTAQKALWAAEAKHRYLVHLKQAESSSEEQRMCTICQDTFSVGVLTICGHQFCKECLMMWFNAHRSCPVCKRKLTRDNLHDITLKPQELKLHSENTVTASKQSNSPGKKTGIYSELNPERLAEIKNIDLDGPNFTTKVDTLVRHLIWLREYDPGAKSIVFSQYSDFLTVLREAFRRHRIGFASFTDKDGIKKFKDDAGVEVFLLHARAHSSGLNLVNASHVFLCEPILNTALELQAIARVDRIGQEHETTVWLYLVEGTVEESIYNLSVQRRMEHMGRHLKGKSTRSTPELLDANLEVANSKELEQASLSKLMGKGSIAGEAVDNNDLWTCLFGHVRSAREREAQERMRSNPAVRGFLAAEAAEARINDEGGTSC